MLILTALLWILGSYLTCFVLYQLALFVANALLPDAPDVNSPAVRRFAVLVPAHNEEQILPRLLASLDAQDYPRDRYRVVVIADNCADRTADVARRADQHVLERTNTEQRGKGYAIRWAIEQIGLDPFDAVVIVDADSFVNPIFLRELNANLERGARVIQSANAVANPDASWFTRLLDVSETMANEIVHPGKEKLGLSCHLLGNGMCFAVEILRSHRWDAFSVGEDWEYYAKLIANGVLVGYCGKARQYHQESTNLRQASWQRMRWSGGRFQVMRQYGPAMMAGALRPLDWRRLDACLPLIFPNPSLGMNLTVAGFAAASLRWLAGGGPWVIAWFAGLAAAQLGMFLIAVLYTRNRLANLCSLVLAPLFLVWKMAIDVLSLFGAGTKQWKESQRSPS